MATKKKKTGKKRGPYKCTVCREFGHRANKCPKAHSAEMILNSLPGEVALASLIPEQFQILAIVEDQTHHALRGAIEGNQRLAENGKPANNSIINAWAELAKRQARLSPKDIARARKARAEYLRAGELYEAALEPIRAALMPQKAKS